MLTQEHRSKLSAAHKGVALSPEHRAAIRAGHMKDVCVNGHDYSKTRRTAAGGQMYCSACLTDRNAQPNRHLMSTYGISPEEWVSILNEQKGKCAICGTSEFKGRGGRPHVDHDHATGKVRALLCHHCNTGLGAFGDSIELLLEAAAYLRGHE